MNPKKQKDKAKMSYFNKKVGYIKDKVIFKLLTL